MAPINKDVIIYGTTSDGNLKPVLVDATGSVGGGGGGGGGGDASAANQALIITELEVLSQINTQTPSFASSTTSGTVAAGATSISIANSGNAAGIVDGASLPVGASIEWTANWINTLGSVSYDATGTSFLISEVR